jgi:hypothetical protein
LDEGRCEHFAAFGALLLTIQPGNCANEAGIKKWSLKAQSTPVSRSTSLCCQAGAGMPVPDADSTTRRRRDAGEIRRMESKMAKNRPSVRKRERDIQKRQRDLKKAEKVAKRRELRENREKPGDAPSVDEADDSMGADDGITKPGEQ